jgi:hypothetical protein
MLYYRSLRITLTLLRIENISGRLYMKVITYKALILCNKIRRRLPSVVHLTLITKMLFMVY